MDTLQRDYELFIEQKIQAGEYASRAEMIEAALDDMMVKEMLSSPAVKQLLEERLKQAEKGEWIELDEEGIEALRSRLHGIINDRIARNDR